MLATLDPRVSYKIVIDTETCPLDRDLEEVLPSNMWVYDCGWAVVDRRENVYVTRSFVNADIFLDEKPLMQSAYYAEKVPQYWEDIKAGRRILTSFRNIRKQFLQDVADYGVTQVYAHNMRFDYGTLNNTQRWLTKSRQRYFFPKGMEICDTLKMARDVIIPMPTYKAFCKEHGFVTSRGVPRATAEALYAFITRNPDFKESHTALEDVMIEAAIMAYCFRRHKAMRRLLFEDRATTPVSRA